jgi:hypothetical protein
LFLILVTGKAALHLSFGSFSIVDFPDNSAEQKGYKRKQRITSEQKPSATGKNEPQGKTQYVMHTSGKFFIDCGV